jgi:hypothetical protein
VKELFLNFYFLCFELIQSNTSLSDARLAIAVLSSIDLSTSTNFPSEVSIFIFFFVVHFGVALADGISLSAIAVFRMIFKKLRLLFFSSLFILVLIDNKIISGLVVI